MTLAAVGNASVCTSSRHAEHVTQRASFHNAMCEVSVQNSCFCNTVASVHSSEPFCGFPSHQLFMSVHSRDLLVYGVPWVSWVQDQPDTVNVSVCLLPIPSTLTKLKLCAFWEYQTPHCASEYVASAAITTPSAHQPPTLKIKTKRGDYSNSLLLLSILTFRSSPPCEFSDSETTSRGGGCLEGQSGSPSEQKHITRLK
jgi:hypothetical protein